LRAHWLTAYDFQSRKWAGSRTIKSRFALRAYHGEPAFLLQEVTDYTEGLRSACVGYCDAYNPGRGDSFMSLRGDPRLGEIEQWSQKLIRTNVVAPFLPLLIATRIRFATESDKYLELLKVCEAFAFRVHRLLERRADAGQRDLFKLGHELHGGGLAFDEMLSRLRLSLLAFCPDKWFVEALRRDDYDWYNWAGLKYFLYEYEEHLAAQKRAAPKVSWADVQRREPADTIEHVLPQTPVDSYWTDRFDVSARRRFTNDLGNLALTRHNSSYGRKAFPDKKGSVGSGVACYAESAFFMERELALVDEWTPSSIEGRRKRLVDWAEARWRVVAPDTESPAGRPVEDEDDEDEEVLGEPDALESA